MIATPKRALLAAGWLISVAAANYVGGVVGFEQGYHTELALSGHDALLTATVLRQLRNGNIDGTITFLETQLDSEIVAGLFGEHAYDSPYNLRIRLVFRDGPVAGNAWAFSEVLKYREEFPSRSDEVRDRIMEGLEAYRDSPRPDH
jgi:hypothetical protein